MNEQDLRYLKMHVIMLGMMHLQVMAEVVVVEEVAEEEEILKTLLEMHKLVEVTETEVKVVQLQLPNNINFF